MKYIELPSNLFKLINYIIENEIKLAYKKDLAKALNLSESQIWKQLTDLSKLGYIRKKQEGGGQGKTKGGRQRRLIITVVK